MSSVTYKTLEARRFGVVNQPVNINNNSTVTNVTADGENLNISFVFSSSYEPNIGIVRIEGELSLKETKDVVSKVVSSWKESQYKNIPSEIAEKIHNSILSNCIVEASILAREISLPVPLPAPSINMGNKAGAQSVIDTQHYIR